MPPDDDDAEALIDGDDAKVICKASASAKYDVGYLLAIIRAADHVCESASKTDGAVLEVPRSGQFAFSINRILAITVAGIKPFVMSIVS